MSGNQFLVSKLDSFRDQADYTAGNYSYYKCRNICIIHRMPTGHRFALEFFFRVAYLKCDWEIFCFVGLLTNNLPITFIFTYEFINAEC